MSESEEITLNKINLRTLFILLGIVSVLATTAGTWFVNSYRLNELEEGRSLDRDRITRIEKLLTEPRYTLGDDERRMKDFAATFMGELERRGVWMDGIDTFRISTIKTTAETNANIREIKNLVISMKDDIEEIKKGD